ncbi:MAG TPA: hypothetical protein DER23_04245 [Clostridiales bacterium]|nr:hypothetical protein [Clostridiales bacterium]
MKKIFSYALVLTLLLAILALPTVAEGTPTPKDEVVYGLLNADGSIQNMYVVNGFRDKNITDYGDYSYLQNMTSTEKLSQMGDKITIHSNSDTFYYEGILQTKELPWNISIHYMLDGKKMDAKDLAGKSGQLGLDISITQNQTVNSTFFKNYALQLAVTLDNKYCSDINAENATIVNAGSKKQVSYIVLPGNGAHIHIACKVNDFRMEPITINGIKLALHFSFDSVSFTDQLGELTAAIEQLDSGAGGLLDGIFQLKSGMGKYVDGVNKFTKALPALREGIKQVDSGTTELKNGLHALTQQNEPLVNGALALQKSTFDSVNAQLAPMHLPLLTPENYSQLLDNTPSFAAVKQQLDSMVQFTQGMIAYTSGVAELSNGAATLCEGTSKLAENMSPIITAVNGLYDAAVELNSAVKRLYDGLAQYKKGTLQLKNETDNIEEEIEKKIDEMRLEILGNPNEIISFVSEKNTNVNSVQFVLKTEEIKAVYVDRPELAQPVKLTFWQKLLKLFGLYP